MIIVSEGVMLSYMDTIPIPTWTTGDKLRKAREAAGISTRDMAHRLGCSEKTVNNMERDRTPIRSSSFIAWAQITGVPEWWLSSNGGAGRSSGWDHGEPDFASIRRSVRISGFVIDDVHGLVDYADGSHQLDLLTAA